MSLERDLQSKIAAIAAETITIDQVEEIFSTTVIDTKGFRNFTVVVTPSEALEDTSVFQFVAEDSPDGITYTDVSYAKYLPTRNVNTTLAPYGHILFNAQAPYYFTVGIEGAERYIKIGVNCTTFGRQSGINFGFMVIMEAEDQDFIAYESVVAVPGDNMP